MVWMCLSKTGDVEAGFYPMELDTLERRWRFTCKVYFILTLQLLVTIGVAATVVLVPSIAHFFAHSKAGLGVYIGIAAAPFIVIWPLYYFYKLWGVNYILLGIFTVAIGFLVGLTCAFTSGKVILESAILSAVAMVILTLYTFWAARRGYDFEFLGPFLFAALIALVLFALIQILIPMGRIAVMIFGCVASILFCGYIVYDTDNLIKRYSFDQYIWAAVALYLDIINLFFSFLSFCISAQES